MITAQFCDYRPRINRSGWLVPLPDGSWCCGTFHEDQASAEACGERAVAKRIGDSLRYFASSVARECRRERILVELRDAIAAGIITHSRARQWCGMWVVYIYQRDHESPTGVRLWNELEEGPDLDSVLRGPLSPLSPTEGR